MIMEKTALPGVKVIIPRVFGDNRGWFYESYNKLSDWSKPVVIRTFAGTESAASPTSGTEYQNPFKCSVQSGAVHGFKGVIKS